MNKKRLGAGFLLVSIALVLLFSFSFGGSGTPTEAGSGPNGPKPGDPGANPCLFDNGGNREEVTPEHVKDYYVLIGELLRDNGHPWFVEFTADKWEESETYVTTVMDEHELVDPSQPYSALTWWCPGFDIKGDQKVERKAELVSETPLRYQAHKKYWVLYEDDEVIVAILKDCHNPIVIKKGSSVPPAVPTLPPAVTQPPCDDCTTTTTVVPPCEEDCTPTTTQPQGCPPPDGVPPEQWDPVECEKLSTPQEEQQNGDTGVGQSPPNNNTSGVDTESTTDSEGNVMPDPPSQPATPNDNRDDNSPAPTPTPIGSNTGDGSGGGTPSGSTGDGAGTGVGDNDTSDLVDTDQGGEGNGEADNPFG